MALSAEHQTRLDKEQRELDRKEERRLRREAYEAQKEAAEAAKTEQRELDEDTFYQLVDKHGYGEVKAVWSDGGLVVIGRPKKAAISRWQEMISRGGKEDARATRRRMAAETLALQCLVYPTKGEYEELVERWPGIPTLVAAACLDFAQISYEEEAEK